MRFEFTSHGIEDGGRLREQAERRIRLALGRFAHRVRQVRVHVTDVNGPRGGVDHEVHVEARLNGAGDVHVTHCAESPGRALRQASDRARRAVRRALSRANSRRLVARPVEAA